MTPLHHDPHFTFRFAEDRIVPRFHLEGIQAGQQVSVYKIDCTTGERLGLLVAATVGEGGWVDLPEPIIVKAGEAFIAVPERHSAAKMLMTALGVAGLMATCGFLLGLVRGGGEFILAVACGVIGGFVVLLGYGPIALVIAALGAVAGWFRRKNGGMMRE
jgi:hypothetical protein